MENQRLRKLILLPASQQSCSDLPAIQMPTSTSVTSSARNCWKLWKFVDVKGFFLLPLRCFFKASFTFKVSSYMGTNRPRRLASLKLYDLELTDNDLYFICTNLGVLKELHVEGDSLQKASNKFVSCVIFKSSSLSMLRSMDSMVCRTSARSRSSNWNSVRQTSISLKSRKTCRTCANLC